MPTAKVLMLQGTSSSAGKSLLTAALCRIFTQRGFKVAPFKAQNMSNNAAVCPDGSEIGRAQAVQAAACGLYPSADMNPVLIKPEGDARSQVIVLGRPWERLRAKDYYPQKDYLWKIITRSLEKLRTAYDLIIIEGAGSPVELNLKKSDIVNMAVARHARSPVLLVGDIDRGGIFSQLLGTYWLLSEEEQNLLAGFIINKFRGDISLFDTGPRIIEQKSGKPVLGVVPYLTDLFIPEEDSVSLEALNPIPPRKSDQLDIAVIHLPRISNFDDFDPLAAEPGVKVRYIHSPDQFGKPAAVILPGSKSTIADLKWLRRVGLADTIREFGSQGGVVVGICGGYQMLGKEIQDPDQHEAAQTSIQGLHLLPAVTIFNAQKMTYRSQGFITAKNNWLGNLSGLEISGYEIHQGQTTAENNWLDIKQRNQRKGIFRDGSISEDGKIWGCYLHGLFANHQFRRSWLASLGFVPKSEQALAADPFQTSLERLSDTVEAALDINKLEEIIWEN